MTVLLSLALASPPDPSIADAVAAGDCALVLERTSAFEGMDERWRVPRARCLLVQGDPAAAEAMLTGPIDGVLGEYARLVRARALLVLGRTDDAAKALDGLALPGEAGREVKLARARLAVQRADLAGFRALMPALEGEPEVGLLYGDVLKAAGEAEKALGQWRAVWVAAAVGGHDTAAAERLTAAGAGEPSLVDRQARLKNLRRNGRIDEAAVLAEELAGDSPDALELARVNLQARRYTEALVHWRAALGPPDAAQGAPGVLFDYALTFARSGDYATAAVGYRRLMELHPKAKEADFASFKLGYMAYDANDCASAVPLFDAHLARWPTSEHLDEALWFVARCHWREGRTDAAVEAWRKLAAERPKSSLVSGAAYWRARARGRTGDADGERSGLEQVIASWPTSGYAWFAAARLGRTFPRKEAAVRPPWPDALKARTDVQRGDALLEVGLRDWARAELAPLRRGLQGRDATLAAAWALIAAGDYKGGQALAKPYCTSPWKDGDALAQQACTPRPEARIVEAVAARYGLDPLLPYGIMTAESALDPGVTSVAGARGLMQLMPAEGPRIHGELYPTRPYQPDDLYAAPYNASMGTAELGMKARSLDGVLQITSLPAVVASYNGGEDAVRRWVAASEGPPEFDEFAEDIGYTETRRYVKRVLGFVMAYRWTYGDPARTE